MISKQTYINALLDAMPDVIPDSDLAMKIVDVLFSVPIRGLENGSSVELPGLGVISIDRSMGAECLAFSPEKSLIKCLIPSRMARAA